MAQACHRHDAAGTPEPGPWLVIVCLLGLVVAGLGPAVQASAQGQTSTELTKAERAYLEAHGPLRVTIGPVGPPFAFEASDGRIEGITPDLLRTLSVNLGVDVEINLTDTHPEALDAVRDGSADIAGLIVRTADREGEFSFSEPYAWGRLAFWSHEQYPEIQEPADLEGHRVAVPSSPANMAYVNETLPGARIVPVDDVLAGIQAVRGGEAEGMYGGSANTGYHIRSKGYTGFHELGGLARVLEIHMATHPEATEAYSILRKGLASIPEEARLGIYVKWTGTDLGPPAEEAGFVDHPATRWGAGILAAGLLLGGGWVATLRHQVRQRTRELAQREESLSNLYEHVPSGIFRVDPKGRIVTANPAFLDLLGFESLEELQQYTAWDLYQGPLARDEILARFDEDGVVRGYEARIKGADGQVLNLEVFARRIKDDDGNAVAIEGAVNDVTDRHQAKQALEEHMRKLVRSNAELERFAYITSHDLKEPARMVRVYAQMLEREHGGDLDEEARELLAFIEDGAQRMDRLITDLLAYAQADRGGEGFSLVDLNTLVDEVDANLSYQIHATGGQVIHGELPRLMADRTQMVQLLQNLVSNGLKFRGEAAPEVRIDAKREPSGWHLTVSDNGIGIDPAYHEKVFEIFQRLHGPQDYPGTGVGLAICRRVVQRHGGRLWIESEPGGGTTFHVYLPDHPALGLEAIEPSAGWAAEA